MDRVAASGPGSGDPAEDSKEHRYRFTFGTYTQTDPWSDVRSLSWGELATLLTAHEVGPKEGICIVPAVFRGARRRKADAAQIDVAFLDSDAGYTLDEISHAIMGCGWTAIISSTHSHLTTLTRVKRGHWDKFRARHGDTPDAPAFFLEAKGYQHCVVQNTRIVDETDDYVFFGHAPCPKFRIVLPLERPWLARTYDNQREANAAWKERVEALAAALALNHDQSCTDSSRVFFLPRRPSNGPPAETAVLAGTHCDIFALPHASDSKKGKGRSRGRNSASPGRPSADRSSEGDGSDDDSTAYVDPRTGELFDLRDWARRAGTTFELRTALQRRHSDMFIGKVGDGGKHHIRCVNEEEHSQAGVDAAAFVINASESENAGFVYHCRHAHCDGRDRLFFLRKMLEHGWLTTTDLLEPTFHIGGLAPKPRIRFVAGQLPAVVDAAEQALISARQGIYQRGAFLVRPGLVQITVGPRRAASVQRILAVEDLALVEMMTLAADWERYDARSEGWVTIDAPTKIAQAYRQRVGHWKLPVLTGLINAPTLRPDGSLLTEAGYDPATGLLLDMRGLRMTPIPPMPDIGAAREALNLLHGLISSFPFVDDPSRSVALSAMLTAAIRRSLRTAPLHGFTAPVAGSGKSMLVDLASVIVTGREAGVIAQGKTEEELEKRLGALLLAGDQVIAIDNCDAPLASEFLCAMLTQTAVRARILGRSEAPELPANAFVTATGNNLVLVGDLTRRSLLCQLDPKHERPELRQFDNNPVAQAQANRGQFLAAALTVLRAYHVAGRPDPPEALGSFEPWSNWVRGALMWLGEADPVVTMGELREHDPRRDALLAVLTQWAAVIGERDVSVRDVIERATEQNTESAIGSVVLQRTQFTFPDFREALLLVAGAGGVINGKRLGKWLAAHQSRIVGGKQIVRRGLSAGVTRWQVLSHPSVQPE